MFKEFKKFAFKGNVIDMAVGVIIGSAFSTIVSSLVNDIIMPFFGFLTAGVDFKELKLVLSPATEEKAEAAILYGSFIQNIINFLIIAFSLFLFIKVINKVTESLKKEEEKKEEEAPKKSEEVILLEKILEKMN